MKRVRLYERNGIWWASWTSRGETLRRSTRAKTQQEAAEVVASWDELPEEKSFAFTEIGLIYFAEAVGCDRIKVGWTREHALAGRLRTLRTLCPFPIVLLGVVRGLMCHERVAHRRLAEDRIHGEWFMLTPRAREFVEAALRDPTVIHLKTT